MPVVSFVLAALAAVSVAYVPPVDGPVVDGFRPPPSQYAAGNRGIDLATEPGQAVCAAADGVVVFAGRIGSAAHVVVLHADGLRTSYSFLDEATVRRGARVHQGDAIGVARSSVHFGVRAGDEYLDPTVLLGGGPPGVHLVPADQRHPLAAWQERRNLLDGLRDLGGAVVGAASPVARIVVGAGWDVTRRALDITAGQWARADEAMRAWAHVAAEPWTHAPRMDRRMERVVEDQDGCTPAAVPTPVRPATGHIAVLVAGLDSTGGGGAIQDVDTAALGYADGAVTQLSYAGGQAPSRRMIAGIPVNDYDKHDTHGDLVATGARLRQLLVDINRLHPGVPVDLLAHSQGGIVVRAALSGADLWAPDLPVIANVVTMGTPHHGAVLATGGALVGVVPGSDALFDGAERLFATPTGDSTTQLSSSSHLIETLDGRGLPAGTRVTSIAASGDLVVDAQMTAIDHATNVVVHVEGLSAHDRLPGDPATARELALALAGRGPTCRDVGPDLVLADTIDAANGVRWVRDLLARNTRLGPDPGAPVHSSPAPGGIGPPG
jgi:hypothetical protein